MRIQTLNHVLTKGIQAYRRVLSLITRGIEDQSPGKPVWFNFERWWKVKGIAEFEFIIIFGIRGKKENLLKVLLFATGQKSTSLEKAYLTTALVEKEIQNLLSLQGRKSINIIHSNNVVGKRRIGYEDNRITVGSKQFIFESEIPLYAIKQTLYNRKEHILGKKEMDFGKKISFNGKRDKTNILVALDLI